MTTVRLIGDVHGKFGRYREIIRDVPSSIQVGDMGVGFISYRGGDFIHSANPPFDAMSQGRHLFIRGNHDNPSVCAAHKYWIRDGSVVDGMFCVGGAVSIDRAYRTEGLDWWADEECSMEALQNIVDDYAALKPEIVVTHECPESVATELMAAFNKVKMTDGSQTRQAFEVMLHHHRPRKWFFGHWHHSLTFERNGTEFRCLNELEHVDVEI